jgi:hypothetical protein
VKTVLLKQYYKAAAWPPFYVIAIPTLIVLIARFIFSPATFSVTGFFADLVRASFYSGSIAVASAGLFLCRIRKIACSFYLSLLSWFLLPVAIIAYIFLVKLDTSVIDRPNDPEMGFVGIMAAVSMFHFIGLVISFNAFRETMILAMREEKAKPALKEIHVRELQSMEDSLT